MRINNLETNRSGEIKRNRFGSLMKITKYESSRSIWVEFEEGKTTHTNYQAFCNGKVKSVFDKTIHNVGYIGEGEYKPTKNNKNTIQYIKWTSMLQRCYSSNRLEKFPTYIGCTVAKEWYNFQIFAKWFDENYYEIEGEKMCLDKDILVKGNKVYSSNTCVFVPTKINNLFIKSNSERGDLPIGVSSIGVKFRASCTNGDGKIKKLGIFNSSEEAFLVYKTFKEELIKETANNYKERIPNILYESLIKYEVEITD